MGPHWSAYNSQNDSQTPCSRPSVARGCLCPDRSTGTGSAIVGVAAAAVVVAVAADGAETDAVAAVVSAAAAAAAADYGGVGGAVRKGPHIHTHELHEASARGASTYDVTHRQRARHMLQFRHDGRWLRAAVCAQLRTNARDRRRGISSGSQPGHTVRDDLGSADHTVQPRPIAERTTVRWHGSVRGASGASGAAAASAAANAHAVGGEPIASVECVIVR